MQYDEAEIHATLQRLAAQERFLVDASTLIVLDKAGLLHLVTTALPTETIPEVVSEVGEELISRARIQVRPASRPPRAPRHTDTDSLVFMTAETEKLAVASEDKKLLRRCDSAGVPYYNAGMLLMRLRMHGGTGLDPGARYRHLCDWARYGRQVSEYLDAIDVYLLKQGR